MDTDMRLRVQETLDELLRENLIPFPLTAHKVSAEGEGEYVVPFYDSRIHSFRFSWTNSDESLKQIVRKAVLDRIKTMGGPPNGWLA